jgi:hypothetical protein
VVLVGSRRLFLVGVVPEMNGFLLSFIPAACLPALLSSFLPRDALEPRRETLSRGSRAGSLVILLLLLLLLLVRNVRGGSGGGEVLGLCRVPPRLGLLARPLAQQGLVGLVARR